MAKPKVDKGKAKEECLGKIKEAMNLFNEDEVHDYLAQVFYRAAGKEELLSEAADEVHAEKLKMLQDDMAIKLRDAGKYETLTGKYIKKGLTLRNVIIKTFKNKLQNVEYQQKAARGQLSGFFFGIFNRDEIRKFQEGKIDDAAAAAADGKDVADSLAKKIGQQLVKYVMEGRNPLMVASDALALDQVRDDRFLKHIHSAQRIASAGQSLLERARTKGKVNPEVARKTWMEFLKPLLDTEAVAKNIGALNIDGTVNMDKIDKFLHNAFDNIINDRSAIFTRSSVAKDQDALKRRNRMYIVFKDWQALNAYNKKFGGGTLFNALLKDIHGSANRIGAARILGSEPFSMWNDLKKAQIEVNPQYGGIKAQEADGLFRQVAGIRSGVSSPRIASLSSALRSYTSMSVLGNLMLNSLNDFSQVGGALQRYGYSYWRPFAENLKNAFGLLPDEAQRRLARQLAWDVKTHMGYTGDWANISSLGDTMNKLSNTFYWANFMEGWTNANKKAAVSSLAKSIGSDSSKRFGKLNQQLRFQFDKFGLNEAEWEVLRTKTTGGLFCLDNVDSLTSKELTELWEKSDKAVPRSQYRSSLYAKVYGLLDDASEMATLDPGAYERMLSTGNEPEGTAKGAIIRAFMQFKSYPISYFRRAWVGGLSEMQGAQAKMMYAFTMAASNFMLGYLGLNLANLAMGKTTPDIADMPFTDLAMLFAPGLGVFAKILNERNQDAGIITDLIMTPSVRLFSLPLATAAATATGNFKKAKKDAHDFIRYANPLGTYPIVSPYFRELMGDKPYLQPGQKQLFGA